MRALLHRKLPIFKHLRQGDHTASFAATTEHRRILCLFSLLKLAVLSVHFDGHLELFYTTQQLLNTNPLVSISQTLNDCIQNGFVSPARISRKSHAWKHVSNRTYINVNTATPKTFRNFPWFFDPKIFHEGPLRLFTPMSRVNRRILSFEPSTRLLEKSRVVFWQTVVSSWYNAVSTWQHSQF